VVSNKQNVLSLVTANGAKAIIDVNLEKIDAKDAVINKLEELIAVKGAIIDGLKIILDGLVAKVDGTLADPDITNILADITRLQTAIDVNVADLAALKVTIDDNGIGVDADLLTGLKILLPTCRVRLHRTTSILSVSRRRSLEPLQEFCPTLT
jgi:hypothetical protein